MKMIINSKLGQPRKKKQLERKAESKRMYDMSLAGKSHSEISEKFGFAPVTIQRRIASFREEHGLPMPKARGRKALPKKLKIRQPYIPFDYDKIERRLINSKTIYNINGIYQTGQMLKCLEICPFVDAVAEFLGRSRCDVYGKLRYYLAEAELSTLLGSLKARRKLSSKESCKKDLEDKIKVPLPLGMIHKGEFDDPVWLKKKYETMSIQKIADLCGVSYETIKKRIIKFNISRRKPWQRP